VLSVASDGNNFGTDTYTERESAIADSQNTGCILVFDFCARVDKGTAPTGFGRDFCARNGTRRTGLIPPPRLSQSINQSIHGRRHIETVDSEVGLHWRRVPSLSRNRTEFGQGRVAHGHRNVILRHEKVTLFLIAIASRRGIKDRNPFTRPKYGRTTKSVGIGLPNRFCRHDRNSSRTKILYRTVLVSVRTAADYSISTLTYTEPLSFDSEIKDL
jgi:hypothetical protein